MKNSIEEIWKEGFLNEKTLSAPKINDLYNQKSMHVVEQVKSAFRKNLVIVLFMSIGIPIVYYFLDALWLGLAASALILLIAWYGALQIRGLKTIDQGATCLDYLKSFDRWLKNVFSKSERIARIYYVLCFLIALSLIWSEWNKQEELIMKIQQNYPGLIFIGNTPLIAVIVAVVACLLMAYFSDRIYRWDIGLMYGRVFKKLEETIAEMEELQRG